MKKNHIYAVALVLSAIGLFSALKFIVATGNAPWFSGYLEIDGGSYIRGMLSIYQERNFLDLKDIYHSPGYQIYLGAIYLLNPDPRTIFLTVKLLAWAMYALSVGLVYFLGERFLGLGTGLIAAVLLSFSAKYHAYCNLLQYEVPLGFLLLCHTLLLVAWRPRHTWRDSGLPALAGLLAAAAVMVQPGYLPLAAVGVLCVYLRARASRPLPLGAALRPAAAYILPLLLIAGFWSAYHSAQTRAPVLVSQGASFRFRTGNNPAAQGSAYPYPVIVEPSGLNFIVSRPARFSALVLRRFLYFMDIKKDVWHTPVSFFRSFGDRAALFETIFYILSLLTLIGGVLTGGPALPQRTLPSPYFCLLLTLAAGLAAPLLVFGSSRFSIPVLPLIFLFQARFFVRCLGLIGFAQGPGAIPHRPERYF